MGNGKVLTRTQRVMDMVTYERTEQFLPYVFLQSEAGLRESLSCSVFPPASLRLLCLFSLNKGRLISSHYRAVPLRGFGQELGYLWQMKSWGRGAERPCALHYPDALHRTESRDRSSNFPCYKVSLWKH